MNKRILLGIDTDLSPPTQYALRAVCELLGQTSSSMHILLLNVIPITQMMTHYPGMYTGQVVSVATTPSQQRRAEEVLHKARLLLQQQGIAPTQIEEFVRVGAPAEELAKVAREEGATLIVVGSRGESLRQKLRRLFLGSVSRRILKLAPCHVMVAVSPHVQRPADLVAWYERAITSYLSEHPETLSVFTPRYVMRQFAPPDKHSSGRKEIAAATLALEQLARNGVLCRHDVKGELRYVND